MNIEIVSIPDVLYFQEGPGVRNTQFTTSGVKLLNVGNINNGVINLDATKIYISEEEANGKYKHFLIDEGDLLIASSGIVVENFHNKIAWAKSEHLPLCMNTSTIRFKSLDKNRLDIKYFAIYLKPQHLPDLLRKLITVSAQLNFGPSHLKQISFPLPPLPIQKRIAEILDAADALKRKDQELLKKYDELAQSIFIDMFGDPAKNEKGWDVKKIVDVTLNFDSFRKPVKSSDREQIQGIYPYYGATGIIDYVNEYLLEGQFLLISEDGKNLVGRYKKIAFLAEGKIWVNNHAHVLQGKENCNNYYLEYFLNKIDLTPYVTGIDQYKLNRSNLDIVPIQVPPIDLQNKFETLIKKIEEQALQATKQQLLANSLFDKLIQKAFTGELVN